MKLQTDLWTHSEHAYLTERERPEKPDVLIVGAGGFLGFNVADTLSKAGLGVRTLSPVEISTIPGRHFLGRTTDRDVAVRALRGCDRVIFLAGNSTPAHPSIGSRDAIEHELRPLLAFAETAALAGCRQFVFTSSGGTVYGRSDQSAIEEDHTLCPITVYGATKVAAEMELQNLGNRLGMDVAIFRISNPFGPGQRVKRAQGFIAAAMAAAYNGGILPIWGDGTTVRDFVYIDDVAQAFLQLCDRAPLSAVLNIGAGRGTTLNEICDAVRRVTGRKLDVRYETRRSVDVPRNVLVVDKARRVIGWEPRVALEEGIAETGRWWSKLI